MATATEIAQRALKRLSIFQGGATASAVDVADAKEALSAMIASWSAEGLDGDTLPLDSMYEAGIIAMLAVRMAEDYNVTPGPVLLRDAQTGWQQLQSAFITPAEPTFDYALIRTPSRRYPITVPISGTTPWKSNTSFGLGVLVTNSGNVYACIMAGVSGATGPTGTSLGQPDGSCTWDYVEAIAP